MKAIDMRALSAEELDARVETWEEQLFRARSNKVLGQLNNTNELREIRKTIARAKTILTETGNDAR